MDAVGPARAGYATAHQAKTRDAALSLLFDSRTALEVELSAAGRQAGQQDEAGLYGGSTCRQGGTELGRLQIVLSLPLTSPHPEGCGTVTGKCKLKDIL